MTASPFAPSEDFLLTDPDSPVTARPADGSRRIRSSTHAHPARRAHRACAVLALATGVCAGHVHATPNPGASTLYSCVDDSGRTITSDRPIEACVQREMRVLNRDGSVRRTIQPPPTAAQRKQAEEAERQRQAEERERQAQKARDRNLLLKFDDLPALEARRSREIATIDEEIRGARERIRFLGTELDAARAEVERWKIEQGKPNAPLRLTQRVTEVSNSVLAEDARVRDRLSERDAVNARFDQDAERLRELLGGPAAAGR